LFSIGEFQVGTTIDMDNQYFARFYDKGNDSTEGGTHQMCYKDKWEESV
jgi:hypothetical protein